MAGGTFSSQNKTRPGAYINFKGIPKPTSLLGVRGIVTFPLAMSWGAELTEILSTDLIDGTSVAKIGYSAYDEEALVIVEALKHAYKALVYRLDTGGTKAVATIGNLTATAKYAGVVGNAVSVAVVVNGAKFDVITSYNGSVKNKQTVSTIAELISNDWVVFTGTLVLAANVGTFLTTGTNGTISEATYTTYLNMMKAYKWNTMGIPQDIAALTATFISYITDLRDARGKKSQIVLYNVDADYEGVISVAQGYVTDTQTISPTAFVAYVAGLTAGSEATKSNTYARIDSAVGIVYPAGVTPYTDAEIEAKLLEGKLILSTRQDGAIVIEQDINTFHTFAVDKGYMFSKNRVIRTLDEINNSVATLWENTYIGKVSNNADGRNLFKADIIGYLNTLQSANGIQGFVPDDVVIYAGTEVDSVIIDLAIQPVDSMEKLYMTVMVG